MGTKVIQAIVDIFEQEINNDFGISESTFRKMAANLNAIDLNKTKPLGSKKISFLPLAQFQSLMSNAWVLADGSNITNTDYGQYLIANGLASGQVFLPDMRGQIPIGINNGRADGKENAVIPGLGLGQQMGDGIKAHSHVSIRKAANPAQYYTNTTALMVYLGDNPTFKYANVAGRAPGSPYANFGYELLGATNPPTVGRSSTVGQTQNTVNSVGCNWYIKVWINPH